jgi:hypothetical protein
MDRRKYRLKKFTSKKDNNKNSFVSVNFDGERKLLPPGEINHVIDVGEEFNKERNASTLYRLIFTINPIFSNPLFNVNSIGYLGTDFNNVSPNENNNSFATFDEDIFKMNAFDEILNDIKYNYKESVNINLTENDGWFGFYDPDVTKTGICRFYDMEPTRKRFDLNSNVNKNWDILITYPYDSDDTHDSVNGGLLIINSRPVEVGGRAMIALATSTYHGLTTGDRVTLNNMSYLQLNGTFKVERLGLDNGDYKYNYFVIDVDPVGISNSLSGRLRRNYNGELSTYYLRKVKNLMLNKDDYEIYPLAFSNSVFNDQVFQLAITEDIDIAGLTDNLGRPLSELFITFIKTDSKVKNNPVFGKVKSGLDLEFINDNLTITTLSNIRRIHDGSNTPFQTHIPLENNLTVNDNDYYLDVVEFNRLEQREIVLTDVLHRFNTINRETASSGSRPGGPRREGYLYKPHHRIKIKEFSLYVEQGNEFTAGIPDYAADLGDGRYLWRDLLDIGVFDGEDDLLDYPFTNGTHYIHTNLCFKTMRQDPFNNYGLYYAGDLDENNYDPADPRGDSITDDYLINRSDDIC